jgi:hypothetical protein
VLTWRDAMNPMSAARKLFAVVAAITLSSTAGAAQAYRPMVTMSITLPDGQVKDLSAPESGLATVTVAGREYGFRPTLHDEEGARIVIAVFDMGGAAEAAKMLAEIDTKVGGSIVTVKTTPTFKVKVSQVSKGSTTTT